MSNPEKILTNTIERCREKKIIIPTYSELAQPKNIPFRIKKELQNIGLHELNPRNLFRITWKNEPKDFGGGFGDVNYLEFPPELTGVKPRILMLIGKYFPTGSVKVGATFGPLVEKLITGAFDPTSQKTLWPSTGNYCRGGVFNSSLLACPSIAVLPEGMSKERFDGLEKTGAEVYTTPGSESNVREVYEKSFSLKKENPNKIVIFNQFEEFGNAVWHYICTGKAIETLFQQLRTEPQRLTALFLTQGSAGTLGAGDYLREKFPLIKIGAGEALQCPTLLYNGYGEHRIEGIGDKHVPWIHNIKNMDLVAGIDDRICIRLMRLFNEPTGREFLLSSGIEKEFFEKLGLLGISGIANLIGCIKMAKYYEMERDDVVFTIATDSMDFYRSRLEEQRDQNEPYTELKAGMDFEAGLMSLTTDHMLELGYWDKKRIHNLKYFTWVEQLGKDVTELDQQWNDKNYWKEKFQSYKNWDKLIEEFNTKTGLG